jgi:hypothetical protein
MISAPMLLVAALPPADVPAPPDGVKVEDTSEPPARQVTPVG